VKSLLQERLGQFDMDLQPDKRFTHASRQITARRCLSVGPTRLDFDGAERCLPFGGR
jgi:hypothetical protein